MTEAFKALAHATARCRRCHLLLPCENCLPDVAEYARSGQPSYGTIAPDREADKRRANAAWQKRHRHV